MSQISPVRPRRRAAARRERVVNSSDDEEENKPQVKEEAGEDEFTPAPQRLTRRPSRRDTQDARATPQTISGVRRNKVNDVLDTAEILSPAPKSVIRNNKNPPPARRSVRAGRKSQSPSATELPALLPTPRPSNSPAPGIQPVMPLADITGTVNNEQLPTAKTPKPIKKLELIYAPIEKPMDIVIRTRAKVVPVHEESSGPRPRIVITYLILTNFKSYAGRQEVGPFHSSFSSVVGPNGSGKSNVIDSLLFVFGFRASKMRQGKISALIHNSAAFPDLEYCEVAVHFQEVVDQAGGKHEVVPDSSLVISRKAFKNNASKYYINMSESNFTTVTTLLRDRGVDLDHKRFLILQGEVESIAQMKPKAATEHDDGLLEYLEDIIGTSKYKGPIEEAAAETATLNDVCLEKSGRVQHVEKEKKSLEGKKDVALAFIKNENELATKQSALYQIFVNECEDNIQVTEEAVIEMQSQLDCELEQHRGGEASIKALQKQYASEMEQFGRLEQSTQATLKELAKMDKEAVKFEEKKKHLNAKAKKLEKSLTAAQSGASESAAYVQRLSDDLERNTGTIAEIECHLRSEETELNSIRENLRGKTQGLSDQINEKQKSLEPWANRVNEKRSMVAIAHSELAILQESNNAGAQAIADAQERLARFKVARAEKLATTEAHKAKQQNLEAEVRDLQAALETLANKEPGARSKLSSARQKADEARANFSNSQTQGNVLAGLMRLAESGRVKGFHGRLGNLGAIDEKYDFAISTACPALDNLVVDSVEVGQQCIEYLRKNNLGRANFILLDRLSQRDVSPMETPENVPRLFDLVRSKDEKFLPAFFSVLQNTLVAEDLEQANRIAYGAKRWRVVTLNGQLIDKSGTMSGGGTRVAKGAMSSKIIADMSKEQVTKLEADQEMLEQDFQSLQKQQHATLAAERALQERMPELITEIQKCLLEIESLDRNMEDTQRRFAELVSAQQPNGSDKDRMVTLQRTISSLEAEIMVLQTETAGIEAEINLLQEKIMEIGGVKLRSQKAKVDGLKEQIGTLTEEISNAEVSKAKTEKQKHKHEKARGDAEAELEGVAGDLERLNAEMHSQTREASDSKREAERAQEELDSRRDTLQAFKTDVEKRVALLSESRGLEIEVRNKLEENHKVLNENQKRLRYWQEKITNLTVHSVTDLGDEQVEESLPTYTRDELSDLDKNVLKSEIAILEEKTQNVNVELSVLAEYRRRVEEHAARSTDLAEAVGSRDTAKRRCEDLRRLRLEGFMEGFSLISLRLKEMYQMITMGGNAELELVDSLDPFSEGILFSVMPPKKSWKNISNLSGGEKTLSSLALVFALHHYKPTPLYVMDEIDAALDFRNVSIVASYIKERTKNAQFIVISLRNNMFELASRLIGVYKVNHMTKSVTVENRDYIRE